MVGLIFCAQAVAQATELAASAPAESTSTTGVFASAVAAAGSLIAAGAAFSLCWKGRFDWEPAEEDIPRGSQKVGGLLIGIVIAILWYKFSQQRALAADDLVAISVYCGILALAFLLVYSVLIGVLVYVKVVPAGPNNQTRETKIIGGLWLTSAARVALKSGPLTVALVYRGSGQDEDLVWPRISRAFSKTLFQLAYIGLVAGGTCALAAISLLIASVS